MSFTYKKEEFHIFAGPCAIESRDQVLKTAKKLEELGIRVLRGGMFKLRTDQKSFQGLREKALPLIHEVKKKHKLFFISEVSSPRQIEMMEEVVDIYQVGARNMFNYELLKELSLLKKNILLKRSFSATVEEWLKASEYLSKNNQVILCERGIRTFETTTRNTLDLNSVAWIKKESSLPVFVDPSHGTGLSDLVLPMSKAAMAAGADGLLIETHPEPEKALCDATQALSFKQMEDLLSDLKKLAPFFGKKLV